MHQCKAFFKKHYKLKKAYFAYRSSGLILHKEGLIVQEISDEEAVLTYQNKQIVLRGMKAKLLVLFFQRKGLTTKEEIADFLEINNLENKLINIQSWIRQIREALVEVGLSGTETLENRIGYTLNMELFGIFTEYNMLPGQIAGRMKRAESD